jgi:hypothetical protein
MRKYVLITDFAYVVSGVAEYDAVARRQGDQQNYIFFLKLLSKLTLTPLPPFVYLVKLVTVPFPYLVLAVPLLAI